MRKEGDDNVADRKDVKNLNEGLSSKVLQKGLSSSILQGALNRQPPAKESTSQPSQTDGESSKKQG